MEQLSNFTTLKVGGPAQKIVQPHAFFCQAIHIWRLQQWMSIRTPVAVALIIGENKENVRLRRRGGIGGSGRVG